MKEEKKPSWSVSRPEGATLPIQFVGSEALPLMLPVQVKVFAWAALNAEAIRSATVNGDVDLRMCARFMTFSSPGMLRTIDVVTALLK